MRPLALALVLIASVPGSAAAQRMDPSPRSSTVPVLEEGAGSSLSVSWSGEDTTYVRHAPSGEDFRPPVRIGPRDGVVIGSGPNRRIVATWARTVPPERPGGAPRSRVVAAVTGRSGAFGTPRTLERTAASGVVHAAAVSRRGLVAVGTERNGIGAVHCLRDGRWRRTRLGRNARVIALDFAGDRLSVLYTIPTGPSVGIHERALRDCRPLGEVIAVADTYRLQSVQVVEGRRRQFILLQMDANVDQTRTRFGVRTRGRRFNMRSVGTFDGRPELELSAFGDTAAVTWVGDGGGALVRTYRRGELGDWRSFELAPDPQQVRTLVDRDGGPAVMSLSRSTGSLSITHRSGSAPHVLPSTEGTAAFDAEWGARGDVVVAATGSQGGQVRRLSGSSGLRRWR